MKANRIAAALVVMSLAVLPLTSCTEEKAPDFSGYERIAELSTLECTFHNVAEIYNDGTDILCGINVGYKKAWFEYDGTINLGVDVSQVKIEGPDANNVVTITVPNAQVLGLPDADESTFSDIYKDTGLLTKIESVDQSEAYKAAQAEMKEAVENNSDLLTQAKERAKALLGQYVQSVGQAIGQNYEIKFVDAE